MMVRQYLVIDMVPGCTPTVIGSYDDIVDAGACCGRHAVNSAYLILQPVVVERAVHVFNHSGARFGGQYTATLGNRRLNNLGLWTMFDPSQPPDPTQTFDAQLKVIDAVVRTLPTVTVTVRETMTGPPLTLHYKDGLPQAHHN